MWTFHIHRYVPRHVHHIQWTDLGLNAHWYGHPVTVVLYECRRCRKFKTQNLLGKWEIILDVEEATIKRIVEGR